MSIFQIAASLFALFMMYATRIHKTKLNFSKVEALSWYSMWGLFIIVALFPDLLKGVTDLLNFSRVFDLLLVGSLMILTVIVVLTHFKQRESSKKWEEFIRQRAIQGSSKQKKN
jgi:hypothetical protein